MPPTIAYERCGNMHRVFLEGKHVGTIVLTLDGKFQYRVKGSTHIHCGEEFSTLADCKKSLEEK